MQPDTPTCSSRPPTIAITTRTTKHRPCSAPGIDQASPDGDHDRAGSKRTLWPGVLKTPPARWSGQMSSFTDGRTRGQHAHGRVQRPAGGPRGLGRAWDPLPAGHQRRGRAAPVESDGAVDPEVPAVETRRRSRVRIPLSAHAQGFLATKPDRPGRALLHLSDGFGGNCGIDSTTTSELRGGSTPDTTYNLVLCRIQG